MAWVRFLRAWDWNIPKYSTGAGHRATKHFPQDLEIRLTRAQLQSAQAAGAIVLIQNPRTAGQLESKTCSEISD